eukprot:Selendium_serpulae@DN5653_c0_g2_i2.p1
MTGNQKALETLAQEYQGLQSTLEANLNTTKQLQAQLHENEMVEEEFKTLEPDAVIYKLVGPVLVRQELPDSQENVQKRITYIKSEMAKIENVNTETKGKLMAKTKKVCCVTSASESHLPLFSWKKCKRRWQKQQRHQNSLRVSFGASENM